MVTETVTVVGADIATPSGGGASMTGVGAGAPVAAMPSPISADALALSAEAPAPAPLPELDECAIGRRGDTAMAPRRTIRLKQSIRSRGPCHRRQPTPVPACPTDEVADRTTYPPVDGTPEPAAVGAGGNGAATTGVGAVALRVPTVTRTGASS